VNQGKTVVMINCSLHATEIGASQMSMKLAYDLAANHDWQTGEILENVILLLIPLHNPDGVQMVVDWYRKYLGTTYEGGHMPWLYHKYVGHDNNRDWYMFTQQESRLTIKVHNEWHPQIILDMHQMGSQGARLFVPPFVDPFEPNVDPIIQQQAAMMGIFIAAELTAQGKAGVMHSNWFDGWSPARAYHHYHGGIRILTEAASVRLATPIQVRFEDLRNDVRISSTKMPLPWRGGDWTLKDIVNYDYAAAMAALTNAARLRENWLRNFYRIHLKAVQRQEPPFAFLIPGVQKDIPATIKMLQTLQLGMVEIHRVKKPFIANDKIFDPDTFIIFMAQPYGNYAKALLENQSYPEIRTYPGGPLKTPYDVVAHTLPLLMGVEVIQIDEPFEVETELLLEIEKPASRIVGDDGFGFIWGHHTNDDIVALVRLLQRGLQVFWLAEELTVQDTVIAVGSMVVTNRNGLTETLTEISKDLHVTFHSLAKKYTVPFYEIHLPRVGLYKSYSASIDEGWTRWVLEQFEIPFQSLFDVDMRKAKLSELWDVIIIPDLNERTIVEGVSDKIFPPQYTGGIGKAGIENLKRFVEQGGTLITMNSAARFAIHQFELTIEDSSQNLQRQDFFIPGSILQARVTPSHPIAYGYGDTVAIFYRRSPIFNVQQGITVLQYPQTNPLLSGWVNGEQHLFQKSALVEVPYGSGRIIMIGFPALYRGQAHATFKFLFNAIFYGAAKKKQL
ncbi:MAG TPA: hypothetical protein ENN22_02250, partial [bacterium]|nr:hypothetical protein [bacterium]